RRRPAHPRPVPSQRRRCRCRDRGGEGTERTQGGNVGAAPARVRRLVAIGGLLAVFQQVTGINTVISYAPTLLQHAGFGNSGSLLANVGIGVVNVGLTIVAIRLLDRVGRRPLLIGGTAGMAVALTAIAEVFAAVGDQL